MAFVHRKLSASFTLGQGSFLSETQSNTVKVDGLRMTVRIVNAGGAAQSKLDLEIYGMSLSVMNALSTLGYVGTTYPKNTVLVEAGDDRGMAAVFQGTIYGAYVDLQSQPEACFRVQASAAFFDAQAPAKPTSYNGSVDVALVLENIAGQLNVPFEQNGVSVKLNNPYFSGSLITQAQAAVDHAGISWNKLSDPDRRLAIWMPGQARQRTAPLISIATGLVNYPAYNSVGIELRTLFNPAVSFGGPVVVESDQLLINQFTGDGTLVRKSGNGTWVVTRLDHTLQSEVPHGAWFSDMRCTPVGYAVAPG